MTYPLILTVAGVGRRLKGVDAPKCLIEFNGKTLLELFVEPFSRLGITQLVLGVGYKADEIAQQIGTICCSLPVEYVFNPLFYETGVGYTVKLASDYWSGHNCIIADGDQLIHPKIAELIMDAEHDTILVDSKTQLKFDEETLVIGSYGLVDKLVWPAHSFEKKENVVGETLVISKLSVPSTYELYPLLGKGEMIDALSQVILYYKDVEGLPWVEIDTVEDLEKAKEIHKWIYQS